MQVKDNEDTKQLVPLKVTTKTTIEVTYDKDGNEIESLKEIYMVFSEGELR